MNKKHYNNFTISVIVPIYNVEKYLRQCIDSIMEQSCLPFEVVLVDDGSTDSSSLICDEYSKESNIVKVIHKKNKGFSEARNTGIQLAQGDWLYFVDADDCIGKDTIESFLQILDQCNGELDFIHGRMSYFYSGSDEVIPDGIYLKNEWTKGNPPKDVFVKSYEFFSTLRMGVRGLYKKNFLVLNELWFDPYFDGIEDAQWSIRLFSRASKMASNENPCYFYRKARKDSISNSWSIDRYKKLLEFNAWKLQFLHIGGFDGQFAEIVSRSAARNSMNIFRQWVSSFDAKSQTGGYRTIVDGVMPYKSILCCKPLKEPTAIMLQLAIKIIGLRATVLLLGCIHSARLKIEKVFLKNKEAENE